MNKIAGPKATHVSGRDLCDCLHLLCELWNLLRPALMPRLASHWADSASRVQRAGNMLRIEHRARVALYGLCTPKRHPRSKHHDFDLRQPAA